jgi:hypothetical protein
VTTVEILDKLRDWLQENVCQNIKLKVPSDDNIISFELVNPTAYSAYMPFKKALPLGIKSAIPGVVVTFEEATDDGENLSLSIRLIHCVYSPGVHDVEKFTPDNEGWRDLLNFMDKTRAAVLKNRSITGITVDLPLTQGFYNPEEQTPDLDPYYFGWITFDVRVPAYPKHSDLL